MRNCRVLTHAGLSKDGKCKEGRSGQQCKTVAEKLSQIKIKERWFYDVRREFPVTFKRTLRVD